MKTCKKCGELKVLSDFHKNKQMRDGHVNECKDCHRKRVSAYAKANRPRYNANAKKYRAANKDKCLLKGRIENTYSRIRKEGFEIVDPELTLLVTQEIHAMAIALEKKTGIKWSLDHIVPYEQGGKHCWDNLRLLPLSQNQMRNNKEYDATKVYNVATKTLQCQQYVER